MIAIRLRCQNCDHEHDRDAVIRALYWAGGASTDIGRLFKISANQVLTIVKRA